MMSAVLLSFLVPGAAHLRMGRIGAALFWFLSCQVCLFLGLKLAGYTQLDYGWWFGFGGGQGFPGRMVLFYIPELGNFLGSQVAAQLLDSVERGGKYPEPLPWRNLGYILSGASGYLGLFSAAHASGLLLAQRESRIAKPVNPGLAATASLVLPGLGHWLTGRRFKACYFAVVILGLFLLGMALGDFADFDRLRHPYYWAGQMALGPVAWLTAFLTGSVRFTGVPAYIDAGLLFTTAAGLFAIVAALDAYHRAESDLLGVPREDEESNPLHGGRPPAVSGRSQEEVPA